MNFDILMLWIITLLMQVGILGWPLISAKDVGWPFDLNSNNKN